MEVKVEARVDGKDGKVVVVEVHRCVMAVVREVARMVAGDGGGAVEVFRVEARVVVVRERRRRRWRRRTRRWRW